MRDPNPRPTGLNLTGVRNRLALGGRITRRVSSGSYWLACAGKQPGRVAGSTIRVLDAAGEIMRCPESAGEVWVARK